MKRFLCVFAIIVIISDRIAPIHATDSTKVTPIESKRSDSIPIESKRLDSIPPATDAIKPAPTGCDCSKNKVPLYRLYHPQSGDHFYTTSLGEANNAVTALGYIREGITGWVLPPNADCTCNEFIIPAYRLYKAGKKQNDHFYTTSVAEASTAAQNLQYKWEGIAFYCAVKAGDCGNCGPKVALHRYNRHIDHFYTTSLAEGFSNVIPYGGTYEGILCYIWRS